MGSVHVSATSGVPEAAPAFAHVVCGVNGSRGAAIAAEQAAILAGSAGVEYVAVTDLVGTGPTAMARLAPARARQALDAACRRARELGVVAEDRLLHGDHAARALLELVAAGDLLAVGAHPGSRAGGIMLGSSASAALHRAPCSVLIARPVPAEHAFPSRITIATDGTDGADAAVLTAIRIVRRHRASVAVTQAGTASAGRRHRIAQQTAAVRLATGTDPVVSHTLHQAPEGILEDAASLEATLLVLGARGVSGLRALGSVSERVAHRAHCSVLVVRPSS